MQLGQRLMDPCSIDPNERVTQHSEGSSSLGYLMPDLPDLSIAVTEIGVIPPPPMFSSSPSPPIRSQQQQLHHQQQQQQQQQQHLQQVFHTNSAASSAGIKTILKFYLIFRKKGNLKYSQPEIFEMASS